MRPYLPALALLAALPHASLAAQSPAPSPAWTLAARRAGGWHRLVATTLVRVGADAAWADLPLAESGWRPGGRAADGRAGLWNLSSAGALHLGLRMDPWLDERLDPVASTVVVGQWLARHRVAAQGGRLPLDSLQAVYHALPGQVGGPVESWATITSLRSRLEWSAATSPASIEVRGFWPLSALAQVLAVSADTLVRMNPHLLRGYTHPSGATTLYVPAHTDASRLAQMPPARSPLRAVSLVGATDRAALTRALAVPVTLLQQWNPGLPAVIEGGTWVRVPSELIADVRRADLLARTLARRP